MRAYHVAGDLKNARQALDKLRAVPGYQEIDLYDAMQVRVAHSPALICAAVLLDICLVRRQLGHRRRG